VSHGTFEPKINEVVGLREIMCSSVICIIHHYYIRVKRPKSNRGEARKKHTKIFSEYVKETDMGGRRAEGNIKVDLGKKD
jgi:hypothetical protein